MDVNSIFRESDWFFRRLVVMVEDTPRPRALLASPGARELLASVLAVVERGAGYHAARNVTLRNLLGI